MQIKSAIILTGGLGTRLAPLTDSFNKHMVPINNKFIIDYPLNTLKSMGINNLTVVLGGTHFGQIVSYIKDGEDLGMSVNYVYQNKPMGIAQAINLCRSFIHDDQFVTILGDNIYENPICFIDSKKSSQIVLYDHPDLYRFGVASYENDKLISIIEKPRIIDDRYRNYAITGCYLFDQKYFEYFDRLRPSDRGEYEIVDIIKLYASAGDLERTFADGMWSDAGNHESVNYVTNFFYNKGKTQC
jgi:glucose-1-phosphate thymidylyltransferase